MFMILAYNVSDVDDIKDIHKYLMTKNDILKIFISIWWRKMILYCLKSLFPKQRTNENV